MMKQPWPRFPQFSSFFPHWAHQTSLDVVVDVLINSLALWQKFCVDNSMDIKKSNQHHLGFGLEHPRLFGIWWQCALPFKVLPFGEWIVLEDPWLIASNNSFQLVRFSFELLQNVLTHLHSPLLLSFIQQPWYHFWTDLPHLQIFRNDPPYTLSLFIPSSSAIILTVRRRSHRTFCLTRSTFSSVLLVDGLPLLWSSSTSYLPSLNLPCHSKRQVLDIVSLP